MKNITFRQLRVFVEVARQGSLARAAQALHLTPPAVTMQMKELESQVGLPLLDRVGRGVALSTAGEYYLVYARKLLSTVKEAEDAMGRFRRVEHGVLTIGIVSTAKYFVPHLLARFSREHPLVEVRLRVAGNREQLVAMMQSGEIDLAVMGRAPREVAARAEAFAAHPFIFVGPIDHPLAQQTGVPVHAIAREPFILREPGSGTRSALEGFFETHHLMPRVTMEISSNETIKQAVISGMGLSFLSLHTVWLELQSRLLSVIPIQDTPVMRVWNIVRLQSRVLSPAAEAFRYYMLEHAEGHLRAGDAQALGPTGLEPPGPVPGGVSQAQTPPLQHTSPV